MHYRELRIEEVDRLEEIDASVYIENAWRKDPESGAYRLKRIDWTEKTLPNGLHWHKDRFRKTIQDGGAVIGCFQDERLVGYASVNRRVFGVTERYVLLEQLFVSLSERRRGIGKTLVRLCAEKARNFGAKKLYFCAASAEDTIAFYHRLGCTCAVEPDSTLCAEDPNDIQLELPL